MAGFWNDIMIAEDMDFTGNHPPRGQFGFDGALPIGSAVAPYIRKGFLSSSDNSILFTPGNGTLDLRVVNNFVPNAVLQEFDDFLGGFGSDPHPKLGWNNGSTEIRQLDGTPDHPGIWILNTETSGSNGALYMRMVDASGANTGGNLALGGGALTSTFVVKLSALSGGGNTYTYYCGLADSATLNADSSSFVDGVYFSYTDSVNSGNWQIKSTASSVTTTENTGTAATTDWVSLTIDVNASGTSVRYLINNVEVANSPIATNIPTAALVPFIFVEIGAGTTPDSYVDLYWLVNQLSNPRPGPPPSSGLNGIVVLNYRQTAIDTTITSTDAIVGISDTSVARTMTMTATPAYVGQEWTVKDESLAAGTNNITIDGNGLMIENASTYVINTDGGSVDIYYNGTQYFIK